MRILSFRGFKADQNVTSFQRKTQKEKKYRKTLQKNVESGNKANHTMF